MPDPYLYVHQNPNAPKRANGLRFFGYPSRSKTPTFIGVHTTESLLDLDGRDDGAESVAKYQATTTRPSSYHRIVDCNSTVMCLPDEAVAFGIGNMNGRALHLSFALQAADWGHRRKADAAVPMFERGARVAAAWCKAYGIPARRITRAQALAGTKGLLAHGDADPERRSDPGAAFRWKDFLARVDVLIDGPDISSTDEAEPVRRDPAMILVLDPNSNKQWLCDLESKRWVRTDDERAGLVAAGVPFLGANLPPAQRQAVLTARKEVAT